MTARANLLASILRERIMVLDGAMGTMIQKRKLVESDYRGARFREHHKELKGANDVLCLTRPDLIREIHCAYLAAGADIIETNTFNSTRIALEDFGLEGLAREMNAAAARIARSACDEFEAKDPSKPRFVAGSLGPTNRSASISPDVENPAFRSVSFDDLVEAYSEQLRGLIEGGADLLFIETVFDTLNAKSALVAAERVFEELGARLPVVVSGTITDASGRTLSGQTVEAFWNSICHADLLAVGFNCALGAKEMRPHVEELSALAWTNIVCYPNAGLPNAFGEYDETPEVTASIVGAFADDGLVTIVGGCCGTTPEHIAAIARRVAGARPRAVPERKRCLRLSGLEALTVFPGSNFINVGERTNVAGSAKFAKFIREGDYDAALAVARQQVENGAQVIDISMDEALIDSEKAMVRFLNLLASDPDICRVPFMIDSSRWDVLAAGLKCVQGKAIVNSISLKEGEAAFLAKAKLLRRYGAAAVVMAFDEEGQAVTAARKIEICRRAYRLMIERAGFPPEDIIFDPNILTVATGMEEHNDYAKNFFEALEAIKRELPHASTSGGVSNVSFAFRGKNALREAMHSVFLYHAIRAGLDMAIVNAGALPVYEEIDPALCGLIEDVLLNRRADATERLIAFAGEMGAGPSTVQNEEEWRGLPVGERLAHALVKGKTEFLDEDLGAAIHEFGDPLRIIEGPLMDGMKRVGELFGAGKMFLPQVVKTARVMKRAVGILMPDLEARRKDGSASSAGTIVLATVKGDVHDIGKNIVSVVLACNNFRVVDLGVMVPSNAIIDAVKRERADLLGLSGLITPSLEEMAHVARDMEREGIRIPLLIGGATTSKTHTAVKIAPERSSATVHVPDASQAVTVAAGLMDAARCDAVTAELTREYAAIRENFGKRASAGLLPLAEARARAHRCDWTKAAIVRPSYFGAKRFDAIAVSDAAARIDWTPFFHAWELKGRYPSVLDDPACGEAARRLYDDARAMLERMEGRITLRAAVGFYPAGSAGDDIVLFEDDARATRIGVVHTLRQQMDRGANAAMALSDFIAPLDSEHRDYLGLFCVNAGTGLEEMLAEFEREKDDYSSILAKALCDRLAEALAELMHEKARKELWGYAPDEALTNEELIAEKYRGIRPAPGYPSCPMHDEKTLIFELLAANEIGMSLTETLAMIPAPSVSGMYFANPEARYFGVGRIGRDQAEDYLRRRNEKASEMQSRFGSLLAES